MLENRNGLLPSYWYIAGAYHLASGADGEITVQLNGVQILRDWHVGKRAG